MAILFGLKFFSLAFGLAKGQLSKRFQPHCKRIKTTKWTQCSTSLSKIKRHQDWLGIIWKAKRVKDNGTNLSTAGKSGKWNKLSWYCWQQLNRSLRRVTSAVSSLHCMFTMPQLEWWRFTKWNYFSKRVMSLHHDMTRQSWHIVIFSKGI